MWKSKDIGGNKERSKLILALITLVVGVLAIMFFGMFLIKTLNGTYSLEDGFYRCMSVIGMFFLSLVSIGAVLRKIE